MESEESPERRARVVSGRVWFRHPAEGELAEQGFRGVDMHSHTNHSDAPVSIADALARARGRGIGLALTDHNVISGSLAAMKEAPDLLVIPGIEVSAFDGRHILVYFYSAGDLRHFFMHCIRDRVQESPFLAIRATTSEILDHADCYSCLCAAAHPSGYLIFNKGIGRCVERDYLPEDLIPRFEALEAI